MKTAHLKFGPLQYDKEGEVSQLKIFNRIVYQRVGKYRLWSFFQRAER